MKILFHHRTASKDGQAVHIEELVAAFRRRGHEVIVCGPETTAREDFGGESKAVARLKSTLPKALYEILELGYSLVAYRRLRRAVVSHRPDVLYERYNLFLPAGAWLRRRLPIPMFLEVNAPLFEERQTHGGLALRRIARWSEEATWRGADMVLPVTRVLADHVRRAGVPERRIAVIPNGINAERFLKSVDASPTRARLGLAGTIVLGFTGFVREWHGLGAVVDLLADDSEHKLSLLVVGDGPGRQALERQAAAAGVADRVRFTGLVQRDFVAEHVAAFDIALQPSVTPYASPLKIFEYLALGRPVVAPKTANIEETLTDERTALLFPAGDAEAFRSRIARLSADEGLRRRIGEAGRRLIDDRGLTWDANARRLEALFEHALGSSRARMPNGTPLPHAAAPPGADGAAGRCRR